jgi:3-deoxy-manno-octulosonate cytidylyltransferase (CMP-KDO synthetase)
MQFHIIIPVKYESSRLPNKPLVDIAGKPMIYHVWQRAIESGASTVTIATDSNKVLESAKAFGANCILTSMEHSSGTQRLAEAVNILNMEDDDIVVNVHADEPLIPSTIIQQVAAALTTHDNCKVATICHRIHNIDELLDPAVVKVILNHRGFAMYFSRAPIPWERENFKDSKKIMEHPHYQHVGIYAYRAKFLNEFLTLPPCELSSVEDLEQLRILFHSGRIHVSIADEAIPQGVNTPEDLAHVQKMFASRRKSA